MPRASSSKDPGSDPVVEDATGAAAPSFEQALEELETIVERMEDGSLSLDQSLAAYQRGTELIKFCESRLADAQARVAVLDGEALRDFTPDK